MNTSMREQLNNVHPQRLRVKGEAVPQELGKQLIGSAIERALDRSSLTKQEAAFSMGYSDSGVMGRWISGSETPQLARLWTLGKRFQQEFVIALAEAAQCEVEMTVKIRRLA